MYLCTFADNLKACVYELRIYSLLTLALARCEGSGSHSDPRKPYIPSYAPIK